MSPNNNFNILAWYDSIDQQNHRKAYVYGTIWGLIAPNNSILPFQFVSPGSLGSVTSVIVKSLETNGSIDLTSKLTISVTDYTDDDGNVYSIIMHKGDNVLSSKLSEGRHYIELKQGSKTWYSEVFTVVSNIDCYIKLEYWDNSNLYFKGGHIEYLTGFKFVCYLSTEIGKPAYPFEEELTERDGYKFIEKQTSSKVYNMTFHAPEFMCDALRLVRMCDNIHITNHGKVYRALSFSVSVDWEDNGDVAAVDAEFETDTVVTKIANILNGPSESGSTFNDALLYEKSSPLMFDEGVVAQYTRTVQVTVEAQFVGKLIRELDEYLSEQIPETAYIAIDLGDGPALRIPLSKIADKYWNYVSDTAEDYLIPKTAKHVFSNMDVVAYATGKYDIVLPIASAAALGAIRVGDGLSIDENGVVSVSGGAGTIKNIIVDPSTGNVLTGVTLSADGKTLTFAKDITAITTSNYATTLDTRYVKKSGDTMTGALILPYGVDSDPAMGLRFKNTDSTQGTVLRWNGANNLILSGTDYSTTETKAIHIRPNGTLANNAMEITMDWVKVHGSVRAIGDIIAYSTGSGDITLPIASANALGAVKIGDGLSISADGTLSANNAGTIGGVQSSGTGNVVTGLDVISGGKVLLYTKGLTALTTADYATTLDTRYVKKSGDTMMGTLIIEPGSDYVSYNEGIRLARGSSNWVGITWGVDRGTTAGAPSNGWFSGLNPSNQFIISPRSSNALDGLLLNDGGDALWRNSKIWHAGNDGAGSGLDADMLDGFHATSFYRIYAITVGGSSDYFYPLVWGVWTPYPDITIQSQSFKGPEPYNCNIIRFRLSATGWSDVPRWCNVEFNRRYADSEVTIDSIWYCNREETHNAVYVRGGLTYTILANVTLEAKLSDFTSGSTVYNAGIPQSAIAPTNAIKAWSYSTKSRVTYDHIVGISDIISQGDVIAYSTGSGDIILPIASSSALGAIKVGSGLSIASDGTLSATGSGSVGNIVINPTSGNVITNAALSSDGRTITFTKDLTAVKTFYLGQWHQQTIKVGSWNTTQNGAVLHITFSTGFGFNARAEQNRHAELIVRTSNGIANTNGIYANGYVENFRNGAFGTFYLVQIATTLYEIWVTTNEYLGNSMYQLTNCYGTWTHSCTEGTLPTNNIIQLPNYNVAFTDSTLPITGGTLTGTLIIEPGSDYINYNEGIRLARGSNNWVCITWGVDRGTTAGAPSNGWFSGLNPSNEFVIAPYDSSAATGLTLHPRGEMMWINNKIWHAGNDGSGSGLDADLLDGIHASGLFTNLSNSGNNLSVTIGGTNKTLQVGYAGSAGNSDTIDRHHLSDIPHYCVTYNKDLDLTSYDSNTWYPCWVNIEPRFPMTRLTIRECLTNKSHPSWAGHGAGFSLIVDMMIDGSGWGTIGTRHVLLDYQAGWGGESAFGGVQQNDKASDFIVWLRGGAIYTYTCNDSWKSLTSSTSGYSWSRGSNSYYAAPRATQGDWKSGFSLISYYGNLHITESLTAKGDVIAYSTGTSNAPFKYWRPIISQGVLSWVNDTSTTTPSSVTIVGQGTTYQWNGRKLALGTINAAGSTNMGSYVNLTGQGLTYQWNGTQLRLGTISAGEGTTSWGSYVNLKGATGPSWSGGAISSSITTNWSGQPFQFLCNGVYFICNHGGTPTLFANTGTGFNSSANIQFTASTVKGVGFSTSSDIRLKKDIETLTNMLDKINNIRAVKFRFKDEKIDRVHYGVIAQEIMEHFKDVVYYDSTDEYSVNYQELNAAISICGIKELYSIIKTQQSRIEELEKRLQAIES